MNSPSSRGTRRSSPDFELTRRGGLGREGSSAGASRAGPAERDLKIDQVGVPVLANQEVLALFEIDVGDIAAMKVLEQGGQFLEEVIGHGFPPLERVAFDERVYESGFAPSAQAARHALQVREYSIDSQLVVGKESPEPRHRQAQERRHPPQLQDRLARRPAIQTGCCEKVVLEGADALIGASRQVNAPREIVGPESPQPGMFQIAHAKQNTERRSKRHPWAAVVRLRSLAGNAAQRRDLLWNNPRSGSSLLAFRAYNTPGRQRAPTGIAQRAQCLLHCLHVVMMGPGDSSEFGGTRQQSTCTTRYVARRP